MTGKVSSAVRRVVLGAALLGLGLIAPTQAAWSAEFEWRQNVQWGPTDITTRYQKIFADRVAERTNGAIKITQFPGSTLMKATEAAKETSRGTLKIDGNGTMFYEPIVPFLKLFSLPFSGLDASDMRLLIKPGTRGRQIVDDTLATHNLKLLAFWDGGTAGLVAREPLPTVDSLRGKKLRIGPQIAGGVLRKIGAEVISMPGSQAVDAMRRHVVDASSIEPKGIISRGYYDVAKYWMDWPILPIGSVIMMNLDEWKRLPKKLQDTVWATAQETEEEANREVTKSQDAALQDVVSNRGMTVIRVDAKESEKLRIAGEAYIKEVVSKITPQPQAQELLRLMEEARAKKKGT